MAEQVIFNIGWEVDKACAYTMKGQWWFIEDKLEHLRIHYKFFYVKIDILVKFYTFVFISAVISKGWK